MGILSSLEYLLKFHQTIQIKNMEHIWKKRKNSKTIISRGYKQTLANNTVAIRYLVGFLPSLTEETTCNYLFVFLHIKPLLKRDLLQNHENTSSYWVDSFRVDPFFKKKIKTILRELPPLKVYLFLFKTGILVRTGNTLRKRVFRAMQTLHTQISLYPLDTVENN